MSSEKEERLWEMRSNKKYMRGRETDEGLFVHCRTNASRLKFANEI
jgi:hypothetical protein